MRTEPHKGLFRGNYCNCIKPIVHVNTIIGDKENKEKNTQNRQVFVCVIAAQCLQVQPHNILNG